MENEKNIGLTASEISPLWAQYLNDSASICILSYFLRNIEDEEIKSVTSHALELSQGHIKKITEVFKGENYAIPDGFKLDEDVDLKAPKLFSDVYVLNYLNHMAIIGQTNYSGAVSGSIRRDITDYYIECMKETMHLYKVTKDLLLKKGLFQRSAKLPKIEEIDYVEKQGFVLDIIGEKRPLLASEVSSLYSNLKRNALGVVTLTGFSQVAQSKEVKKFLLRGIDIGKKHVKVFGGKLEKENLPVPMSISSEVTTSTSFTFSDKLMMFFTSALIGLSIGFYGTAMSQSPRVDLGVLYNRLSLEVQKYSEDGTNILIKNRWMEQPPMTADRGELAKKSKG
ncbi:DUF3231 family protein [Virgibacillus sp. MSP4-1]|uniref:DUF3231 family protein n=1 Tax=Virgibacillus sp. MSP4-1 TaxID=2700081 RepID=UPI0003AA3E78|nr:DUF3231 family protein [Virgibacillus sp. MSP4-1]QHS22447.1 DUF3231 family protein [Virgibacillus sp. MSP4-1]